MEITFKSASIFQYDSLDKMDFDGVVTVNGCRLNLSGIHLSSKLQSMIENAVIQEAYNKLGDSHGNGNQPTDVREPEYADCGDV